MSRAPAGNLKSHIEITIKLWIKSLIEITPATTTIIDSIIVNPIWAALADVTIDELVLSIKMGGTAILLNLWMES